MMMRGEVKRIDLRRSARFLTVLFVAPLAMLTACDDSPTDPPATTRWTAELTGTGEWADVEGAAQVDSGTQTAAAQVEITGAEAGAEFAWYIAAGSCADPDEALGEPGDYDALEVDDEGEASATAALDAALDEDESYHVALHPADDAEEIVVCSDLATS